MVFNVFLQNIRFFYNFVGKIQYAVMNRIFLVAMIVGTLVACSTDEVCKEMLEADSLACVYDNDGCKNTIRAREILKGIDRGGLNPTESALYSLDAVQCKYKNMGEMLPSDVEEISKAEEYFGNKEERGERHIRALIFKGATLEELGDESKIEAVECYNKAIDLSNDDCTYWQGYAKYRLGCLYDRNSTIDRRVTARLYREAAKSFIENGDTMKATICYFKLGSYYCQTMNDSCLTYAQRSFDLARQIRDTENMSLNKMTLAAYHFNKHEYELAKKESKESLSLGGANYRNYQPYYYIACSDVKLGQLDSARVAAAMFEKDTLNMSQHLYLQQLIAEAEGRHADALRILEERYVSRGQQLEGELQRTMVRADLNSQNQRLENELLNKHNRQLKWGLAIAVVVAIVVIALAGMLVSRQRMKKKIVTMESVNADLRALMADQDTTNETIRQEYERLVSAIKSGGNLGPDVDEINTAMSASGGELTDVFFKTVDKIVERRYVNVMSRLRKENVLSAKEMSMVSLILYGFNAASVATMMGYTNVNSYYVIRHRIETKLGVSQISDLVKEI